MQRSWVSDIRRTVRSFGGVILMWNSEGKMEKRRRLSYMHGIDSTGGSAVREMTTPFQRIAHKQFPVSASSENQESPSDAVLCL